MIGCNELLVLMQLRCYRCGALIFEPGDVPRLIDALTQVRITGICVTPGDLIERGLLCMYCTVRQTHKGDECS